MKKASSSFMLLVFAALFVSLQSYAQVSNRRPVPQPQQQPFPQNQVIQEQVNLSMRSNERLRVSELLRLQLNQENNLEIVSLKLMAESLLPTPSELQLVQRNRVLATDKVKKGMKEVTLMIPAGTSAQGLELDALSDIYIQSITAEVRSITNPGPGPGPGRDIQVAPHSLITLKVSQIVRGHSVIPLEQLARRQLGVTLKGAQIERVVVEGQPYSYGSASVQVELNNRPASDVKYLSPQQRQVPLQIKSIEEVRSLELIVTGDAQITDIRIRVGQVRPQIPEMPRAETVIVNQEIRPRFPIRLSEIVRQDNRMIRALTINARSLRQAQAQISLISGNYNLEGTVLVQQYGSVGARIVLRRPMSAHELTLDTSAPSVIESLQLEYEVYPGY